MKDQLLKSCKYRFLAQCSKLKVKKVNHDVEWNIFLNNLIFIKEGNEISIYWDEPTRGCVRLDLRKLKFYIPGDSAKAVRKQIEMMASNTSQVRINNEKYINKVVKNMVKKALFEVVDNTYDNRIQAEKLFHNNWAEMEDLSKINVLKNNEVCTAPEMRYIIKKLGTLTGKRVLDVGCGLGEASVYFSLKGASVTALDLSEGMLKATERLAKLNNVKVRTILATAENTNLDNNEKFDIIYAGNLFHHVNIETTLNGLIPHLSSKARLVSWDPIAYNPLINIYRNIAKSVRTDDEHPFTSRDIKLFQNRFSKVETKYLWLSTLLIFIVMFLFERRNPNKERYWKVVVHEGNRWSWLYYPLEKFDKLLLKIIPSLKFLCWNVVIIATK